MPVIARQNPNMFTDSLLDRAAQWRGDAEWLSAHLLSPTARLVVFSHLRPLLRPASRAVITAQAHADSGPGQRTDQPAIPSGFGKDIGWITTAQAQDILGHDVSSLVPGTGDDGDELSEPARAPILVFLGLEDSHPRFALDISHLDQATSDLAPQSALSSIGTFEELRGALPFLSAAEASVLAQAKSMLDWHGRHRFCAVCGGPTIMLDGGYKRQCLRCGAQHFPRTDPVVIAAVTLGDRCLLGRSPRFPPSLFSCLAGFVEPGECLEEAVMREVCEEVGVQIRSVRYHSSQPWPFPSSLMIGCSAEAEGDALTLDQTEIVEARWFDRDALATALAAHDQDRPLTEVSARSRPFGYRRRLRSPINCCAILLAIITDHAADEQPGCCCIVDAFVPQRLYR